MGATKRKRVQLTEQEKLQKNLSLTISRVFKRAGFLYLPTRNKHHVFGGKDIEIDGVYLFENIILFCEDTISKESSHAVKTAENARIIENNFKDVLDWLKDLFPDKFETFSNYTMGRYQKRFLYFPGVDKDFSEERFSSLIICRPKVLRYFDVITTALKKSSRFEVFRFLKISHDEVGHAEAQGSSSNISVNIICPEDRVGLSSGVRAVSFMMAPDDLLKYGYVLRKDNWESPTSVYQRLVEPSRISSIRKYIAETKRSFLSNIIVALPEKVEFRNAKGDKVSIEDIQEYDRQYSVDIPREFNAIRIIDGQHRVYAYHEGEDANEQIVSELRERLHLLVTGLVFPPQMSATARAKYESQIFFRYK